MKAILTKTLPCTATLPTRIKASDCDGNSITLTEGQLETLGCPSTISETAHRFAAAKLRDKMGWQGELVSGWTGEGYAHCFLNPG